MIPKKNEQKTDLSFKSNDTFNSLDEFRMSEN